jgi:hypothetical protein
LRVLRDYDVARSVFKTKMWVKFVHLRYSLATGVFLGRQESSGILELGENGDEFTTDSSTVVFDANGNPGVPSCANAVGIRFEIDE